MSGRKLSHLPEWEQRIFPTKKSLEKDFLWGEHILRLFCRCVKSSQCEYAHYRMQGQPSTDMCELLLHQILFHNYLCYNAFSHRDHFVIKWTCGLLFHLVKPSTFEFFQRWQIEIIEQLLKETGKLKKILFSECGSALLIVIFHDWFNSLWEFIDCRELWKTIKHSMTQLF